MIKAKYYGNRQCSSKTSNITQSYLSICCNKLMNSTLHNEDCQVDTAYHLKKTMNIVVNGILTDYLVLWGSDVDIVVVSFSELSSILSNLSGHHWSCESPQNDTAKSTTTFLY